MNERLQDALDGFVVSDPRDLASTPHARLWRVRNLDDQDCVLKLYKSGHFGNESAGIALMTHWADAVPLACVQILGEGPGALLMEDVPGPLLGDSSRKSPAADLEACETLALVAKALHAAPLPDMPRLPRLELWFQDLFELDYAPACPVQLRRNMDRAATLARILLTTPHKIRPLHGDLHHDNVLVSAHPKAIDAKGVLGDPAYELANALRNPKGCDSLLRDPDHQRARLSCMAQVLDVDQTRLAGWAAAKCALSIAWRAGKVLWDDTEDDLLALLLDLAQEEMNNGSFPL